jgi:hypothetical protein
VNDEEIKLESEKNRRWRWKIVACTIVILASLGMLLTMILTKETQYIWLPAIAGFLAILEL